MYLHNERNHASLWALDRERQTRLAHRVGRSAPKAPPELAIDNMRALPLNMSGFPTLWPKHRTCLPQLARASRRHRSRTA
jgi:hypothetical protein